MKITELFDDIYYQSILKIKTEFNYFCRVNQKSKKIMKNILATLIIVLSVVSLANAQDYKTGIGIRGGLYNGLTLKHFIGEKTALEGIVDTRWHGFDVTVLYELHNSAFDVDRLNWYYGVGGHVGFHDGDYYPDGTAGNNLTTIGVDGILGIEYNFREAPINISLDWKPAFNLVGESKFWGDGGAFSIRYIF